MEITNARQARTLSPSHMRQCIMAESRFDFLRELVKEIPNISWTDEYMQAEGNSGSLDPSSAIMPATTSASAGAVLNGHNMMQMVQQGYPGQMDRPRRSNYQRPMSFDASGLLVDNSHQRPQFEFSGGELIHVDESLSGILKRKLLDPSRRSASTDGGASGGGRGHAKLARLDSSPAAFHEPSMLRKSSRSAAALQPIEDDDDDEDLPLQIATRRGRSGDGSMTNVGGVSIRRQNAVVSPLSLHLLPPTVNISSESISTPIIKIDYNQPGFAAISSSGGRSGVGSSSSDMTPVINIDFSNLVSPVVVPSSHNNYNASSNGNKLILSTVAVEAKAAGLATPNLTTPTRLNFVPPFGNPAPSAPAVVKSAKGASALEMDEDYDDL